MARISRGRVTGSAIEAAWRGLHFAEEEFVLHAQEDWVLERLSETQQKLHALGILGPGATAAQKVVLETQADGLGKDERQALKATLGALNLRSDNFRSDLRTLRNILFSVTTLLLLGLAALALAAAIAPHPFALCGVPAPSNCQAPTVWQVEIAGGFGGLLSAVVFLSNLRAQNTPYMIWLYQGLLKAPTGAALAVILIFLVQTGLLGFLKANTGYIIPYAFAFGFAQQAATQLGRQLGGRRRQRQLAIEIEGTCGQDQWKLIDLSGVRPRVVRALALREELQAGQLLDLLRSIDGCKWMSRSARVLLSKTARAGRGAVDDSGRKPWCPDCAAALHAAQLPSILLHQRDIFADYDIENGPDLGGPDNPNRLLIVCSTLVAQGLPTTRSHQRLRQAS